MKPLIKHKAGWWYVLWRYPHEDTGIWSRRCLTWHVAMEQLFLLYLSGQIGREAQE